MQLAVREPVVHLAKHGVQADDPVRVAVLNDQESLESVGGQPQLFRSAPGGVTASGDSPGSSLPPGSSRRPPRWASGVRRVTNT